MNLISDIISGIISPLTNVFNTWLNTKKDVTVEQGKDDVAVIQSRNTLLGQIHSDPAIAVGWYLFIVPTGVWYTGIVLYCLLHPWFPQYQTVLALPTNIMYIPYAVIAFLFGLTWRGRV